MPMPRRPSACPKLPFEWLSIAHELDMANCFAKRLPPQWVRRAKLTMNFGTFWLSSAGSTRSQTEIL